MQEVEAKDKFKKFARLGYASRGVVYLVVGGLAVLAAFGQGGQTTNSKGAVMKILQQPFGNVLVAVLVIGLLAYSAWRVVQAVKDVDHHGTSGKGLAIRAGLFVSAITHIGLAWWAASLLLGNGGGSSGSGGGQGFISTGWGQAALAVAGIAVIGAGIAHLIKGWTARFERYMAIPPDKNSWAKPLCQFGLIARGIVWGIVGWFLIRSMLGARSGDIKGMEDALSSLRDSPYGTWVLAIVAAGLFAFGIYSILEALYRRINTSSS